MPEPVVMKPVEAVTEPVDVMVDDVIDPVLSTTKPVEVPPLLICNAYCGVVVPIPTLPVVVIVPDAIKEEAVMEPVDRMVDAVIEPVVSTTKAPFAAVMEPVTMNVDTVVEPALSVLTVVAPVLSTTKPPPPAVIEPVVVSVDTVIEPAVRLDTVVAPAVNVPDVLMEFGVISAPLKVIPVSPAPFPEKYAAVTVPFA